MRTQFILATVLLFACRVFGEDTTLAAEQAETEATIVAVEVTSEDVTEVPIEDVQEVTSQPPLPAPEMPRQPMMMYPPQPNPAPSIHFHPAQTHMMRTHIYPRHQFSVFPFNPSMVRRQGPNFIPLPPQNQPVFDPAISCENQGLFYAILFQKVFLIGFRFQRKSPKRNESSESDHCTSNIWIRFS